MRFGLPEDIITKLNEVFEVNAKVDKALIFGSRAKGNYRSDSDIDIAIKGADITLDDILKMQVEFEEKGIKYKIDLVDYHTIKEKALTEHIDRVGIEMYSRWKESKLGEICTDINYGYTASATDNPIGPKFLRITDIVPQRVNWETVPFCEINEKDHEKYKLEKGDIVIARTGATTGYNYTFKDDVDAVFASYLIRYRIDKKRANPFFIEYVLKSDHWKGFVEGIIGGSAQPGANAKMFAEFNLFLPPINEQTAISELLSSLEKKIDLLHRQNKTLEQLAETLFRQWFVGNQKIELRNGKLGELIETTLGGEWGKEIAEGDYTKQVCCIRGTDIADLQTGLAERTPIRFVKERKFESIEPKDGDLILEISGGTDDQSTGRTIYITELNKTLFPYPLVFSNFCRLLRPRRKEYCYFLFLYIQYLYKQDEFFNLENGSSGIKNLDYKYLLFELEYPLPEDKGHILNFNKEIEIYFEKINKNKHQILTLKQLRDALLPKLMNGEVRIDFTDSQLTKPVKSKKANVG